jgi:outer membrane protein OmpA-like peptidoglycan-associated protein
MRSVTFLCLLTVGAFAADPATAASASRYAQAQARFLDEAAQVEADEGDPINAEHFRSLADLARSKGGVTVDDLPQIWRDEVRNGRRDTSEARDHVKLVRIEKRLAELAPAVRERYADQVAHAAVDTFWAREELSERRTWNTWAGVVLRHAEQDLEGVSGGDRDGDTILDADDRCPDEPEDFDGYEDEDGCPEKGPTKPTISDRDGDTIPDDRDRCPDTPESKNGIDDEDGCPELMPVHFASDSARLDAEAIDTLRDNSDVLKAEPSLAMRLEGHCDSQNTEAYNYRLGQRRADAVKQYLVDYMGIAAPRLETSSAGEDEPIADNATERGRRMNRRVEFLTLPPR